MKNLLSLWKFLLLSLLLGTGSISVKAQIQVQLGRPNMSYLQYESIIMEVRITNVSGRAIRLESGNGESWLRFFVRRSNGMLVRPTQQFEQPPVELQPGDTARFGFDLLPFYLIRELDTFKVQAFVRVPGLAGDMPSNSVEFSVVKGQTLWRRDVGVPGTDQMRALSLISFYRGEQLRLYAQIESEAENLVFACLPMGSMFAGDKMDTQIERQELWHILFRTGPQSYQYYKFSMDGQVLGREAYSSAESRPQIALDRNGRYAVIGGLASEQARGDTLSGTQPGSYSTKEKPVIGTVENKVSKVSDLVPDKQKPAPSPAPSTKKSPAPSRPAPSPKPATSDTPSTEMVNAPAGELPASSAPVDPTKIQDPKIAERLRKEQLHALKEAQKAQERARKESQREAPREEQQPRQETDELPPPENLLRNRF